MSVDAFNFPLNTFEEEDITSLYRMEMQITTAEISNNQCAYFSQLMVRYLV